MFVLKTANAGRNLFTKEINFLMPYLHKFEISREAGFLVTIKSILRSVHKAITR